MWRPRCETQHSPRIIMILVTRESRRWSAVAWGFLLPRSALTQVKLIWSIRTPHSLYSVRFADESEGRACSARHNKRVTRNRTVSACLTRGSSAIHTTLLRQIGASALQSHVRQTPISRPTGSRAPAVYQAQAQPLLPSIALMSTLPMSCTRIHRSR